MQNIRMSGMEENMYQAILQGKGTEPQTFLKWLVEAKRVDKSCEPGQFVIVRKDADSERIPLTICDYNGEKGTISIVFQTVGASTERMVSLQERGCF